MMIIHKALFNFPFHLSFCFILFSNFVIQNGFLFGRIFLLFYTIDRVKNYHTPTWNWRGKNRIFYCCFVSFRSHQPAELTLAELNIDSKFIYWFFLLLYFWILFVFRMDFVVFFFFVIVVMINVPTVNTQPDAPTAYYTLINNKKKLLKKKERNHKFYWLAVIYLLNFAVATRLHCTLSIDMTTKCK